METYNLEEVLNKIVSKEITEIEILNKTISIKYNEKGYIKIFLDELVELLNEIKRKHNKFN